jgi:hypothetical protein
LEGIITTSTHIVYKTKNDKLRTRCYSMTTPVEEIVRDTGGITHEMLKVTLRSGEVFAVDITGAQYGYHEPVTPWTKYQNDRILFQYLESGQPAPRPYRLLQVNDYSLQKLIFFQKKMNGDKTAEEAIPFFFAGILKAMSFYILDWQGNEKLSLRDMWKLPEKTLCVKLNDLMDFVEWRFHSIVQHPWSTVNGKRLAAEHKHPWVHGKK